MLQTVPLPDSPTSLAATGRDIAAAPLSRGVLALAVLSLLAMGAFVSYANFWYAYDDAWITYRVAYNFATGAGFVFNVGERVLVTTAPLYGLLLGVLGWLFGPDRIPMFSGVLSGLSATMAGLALFAWGYTQRLPLVGWIAGYFLLTNLIFFQFWGGEMPLETALGLWAFVSYARGWRMSTAVLLALTALARPDGVIAALVLFSYDTIRHRRLPWREGAVFMAILAPFMLASWWYFGAPLPATVGAKFAQRDSQMWTTYGKGLREWLSGWLMRDVRGPQYDVMSLDPGTFSFWVTLGLPALLVWYRRWWLLLSWPLLFILAYRTMKIPFYHWYAAPAIVVVAIVAACGIGGVVALVRRFVPRAQAVAVAAGVLLAGYATHEWVRIVAQGPYRVPGLVVYEEAGRWLRTNTPPDSTVAYYEIGYVGYYSQRRMIDPLGLLDPKLGPHVAKRDFVWPYEQGRPTYILELSLDTPYNAFKQQPWFPQEYRRAHVFSAPGARDLILWERAAPAP